MKKHPNIVFIMADDMGYGDVGCYNAESLIPTQHIDRLAQEGTRFTQAHSGCALCTPTRYALMTGRYQWRTSKAHSLVMPYDPPLIPPERLTMASMLKEAGYVTGCVGKWHLGLWYRERKKSGYQRHYTMIEDDIDFEKPIDGGPLDLGFDHFFGTAGCSTSDAPYCYIRDKHTVGTPTVASPPQMNKEPGVYPGLMVEDWDQERVDTTFLDEALAFIDARAEDHSKKPFFLYYPLSAPHIPWLTPGFIRGASREGPRGDMNVLVDWCVGQVMDKLDEHGLVEDTLLIFTSDNGPQAGENGHDATAGLRGLKNTPYEGGHRVPFIVRWPGHAVPGTACDVPLSLTDMMATFAELVGYELPDRAAEDSVNVLPAFSDNQACIPRLGIVAHTGGHVCERGHFSLQEGTWKLVELVPDACEHPDAPVYELYNLSVDPREQENCALSHPDQLRRLRDDLDRIRADRGLRFMCEQGGGRQLESL